MKRRVATNKLGRGAVDDIHSSYKAELDSPVWRVVKALSTWCQRTATTR